MSDVTKILCDVENGDRAAAGQLLPLVYEELRKLALHRMANEKPGQTLQATALVHGAYLRLVDTAKVQHWNGRGHFFAAAAEAMRRILIENARRRGSVKHGGEWTRGPLVAEIAVANGESEWDLLALDEALSGLADHDSRKASLVKLRLFTGLSLEEAAAALQISPATAKRDWIYARAWLYGRLSDGKSVNSSGL